MKSPILRGLKILALSAALVAAAIAGANAAPLHRLAADFQNNTSIGGSGEIFTVATPGSGGLLAYAKTLSIPFSVVYVTFSAQGDVHKGSALLMQAQIIDDVTGVKTVCEPLAGQTAAGGGGSHLFPNWYTLLILPTDGGTETATNNCVTAGGVSGDGGGGSADCHDNAIMFSCCAQIRPDAGDPPPTHTIRIRLADLPGGDGNFAFYERSTIYIDASPNPGGTLCQGVGIPHPVTDP